MSVRNGLAAVLTGYGKPLEVQEVRVPEPEPGALLVAVEAATVCGSDVHVWQGAVASGLPFKPPLILGHEIVGRIVTIGPGAERDSLGQALRVGDRVVWEHESCGACPMCSVERQPTLCSNRRVGMFTCTEVFPFSAGGFSEYSYVWPKSGRIRVPDGVATNIAAAGSCALRTAVSAFEKLGPIDFMSRIVVLGSGPLGLFATALASWHHPRSLVVVGAPDDRLDLAREWGATEVISITQHPDPVERAKLIQELTGGGPDVVLEMAGAPTSFAEGLEMAARNARYVVVGSLGPGQQPVIPARLVGRGLRISGCLSGDISTYHRAMEFLKAGANDFRWEKMFSGRTYGLAQATDALISLKTMAEMKPLVVPAHTA